MALDYLKSTADVFQAFSLVTDICDDPQLFAQHIKRYVWTSSF